MKKWWSNKGILILIPLIAIVTSLAIFFVVFKLEQYQEYNADITNEIHLIDHTKYCDGKCHLISVSRAPYENTRTYYECEECHEIFAFYNSDIPIQFLNQE